MSRTKGALNQKTRKIAMKKKRGRPRNVVISPPDVQVIKTKKIKFIGYCPVCKFLITKLELESKKIFLCPSCNKRGRLSLLKKEVERAMKYINQKEYLASTINAEHHGMPSFHEPDIKPKDLKIQDI